MALLITTVLEVIIKVFELGKTVLEYLRVHSSRTKKGGFRDGT